MSYNSKAERWAIKVLEAVWADKTPPKNRRYGADDLRRMLDSSTAVADRFTRLRAFDGLLAVAVDQELADRGAETPPSQQSSTSVGAFTFSVADAPQRFERRISSLWEAADDPLKDQSTFAWPVWSGVAATAAAAIMMLAPQSEAPSDELTPRGAAGAESGQLSVTPYCLLQAESGTVETRTFDADAPCPPDARLATSVTDAAGRELSVLLLGVQHDEREGISLQPYSPSPGLPQAARLEVGATEQRIGPVRRLETNHTVGDLDVIAITMQADASWEMVEPMLVRIMNERGEASAERVAGQLFVALKTAGVEPVEFAVTRSHIAVP